jgi:O-acetylhomoserine/O-acetylserine sulfhydrylase-like pyridoxal-dependent enzyme
LKSLAPDSLVVHAGKPARRGLCGEAGYTPSSTPIHNAVTYTYPDVHSLDAVLAGSQTGYVYTRFANPTVDSKELEWSYRNWW